MTKGTGDTDTPCHLWRALWIKLKMRKQSESERDCARVTIRSEFFSSCAWRVRSYAQYTSARMVLIGPT